MSNAVEVMFMKFVHSLFSLVVI